jgi:hypothetical protein
MAYEMPGVGVKWGICVKRDEARCAIRLIAGLRVSFADESGNAWVSANSLHNRNDYEKNR